MAMLESSNADISGNVFENNKGGRHPHIGGSNLTPASLPPYAMCSASGTW